MTTISQSEQLSEFYQYVDAHPELSQDQIGKHFGKTQSWVSKRLTARKHARFTSGEPDGELPNTIQPVAPVHSGLPDGEPTTTLQRLEYPGEPGSPGGLPDIARQSDLDDLTTRVSVLAAIIATLQQQPTILPGSPNGSPEVHPVHSGSPSGAPTHKRGFVLADDLWDAIHTYAEAHHWQIAQVVDLALRTFFAQVGEAVPDER